MEANNSVCGEMNGLSFAEHAPKDKFLSVEGCTNSEFRQRSHTSPSDLHKNLPSRPHMRLARDPVQPSSGSLTWLNQPDVDGRPEEEDRLMPMTRPRANTCPEKRALQLARQRVRNRPPTPPPADVPSPCSSRGSPRERPSSLTHSRECLLDTVVAEVPESTDQKDLQSKTNPDGLVHLPIQAGKLDTDHVCKKLHGLQLQENNVLNQCQRNLVSINITDSDAGQPSAF